MSLVSTLISNAVRGFLGQLAEQPKALRVTLVIGGIEQHIVDLSEEAVADIFESARSQHVQIVAQAGDKSFSFNVLGKSQ